MDLLITTAPTEYDAKLHLPDLNVNVEYGQGTVVGIAGTVIRHGVTNVDVRLCHAYYIRRSVYRRLAVMLPGYMSQALYASYLRKSKKYETQAPTMYSV